MTALALVRRLPQAGVALLTLCAALGLVFWTANTDIPTLRYRLIHWQFIALETQFLLMATLTLVVLPQFLRALELRTRPVAGVAAISLLTLGLVLVVVPRTNRIFFDEHIYQGIGQSLADLRLAETCSEGSVDYGRLQCARGEYNKQPYGYPYLLSLLYRVFGVHEVIAHLFNAACAALLVWVVFFAGAALFSDQRAGLFGALIAGLLPQQLLWSGTAAAEPSAALVTALAVVAAASVVRLKTNSSFLWMVATAVFAMQFRPECVLVAPVVLLIVKGGGRDVFKRVAWGWALALGLVLSVVYLQHLFAVRNEEWGASGDRASLSFLLPNLAVNGRFFLDNERFPALYTALALYGAFRPLTRPALVVTLYFLLFWGVFLGFYAGSYNYGADVRFSLMCYPAAALLAGLGAVRLQRGVVRLGLRDRHATLTVVAAIGFQFLWFMPLVRATGEEAWGARADVAFIRRAIRDLPPQSMVLTQTPHVFLLAGVNAAQISTAAADPGYVTTLLPSRYAGGVYVHWGFWCNANDPPQRLLCEGALAIAAHELVREERDREYRFALYRLNPGRPRLLLKTEDTSAQ